ncbi:LysR family transcriptional regulator [Kiloniella laminariae]|uniref:LysR family transcriptional regulator n=1 Tax=Kiloniella laminariae TaxID=454162 RepID=A0ABT4LIR6_9PROT|nr:LysR family transcriptional regulator [Kiloniella laminariae]MCZ4281004.1 LysR family transcriptional regulator [Kiloniella laminariae]
MDKLTSLKIFRAVADGGSFAGAARELNLSPAMISKHIARLENELGTRLFNRTTRQVNLTEAGTLYHERCRQLLADLEEMDASVSELGGSPSGILRITAPMDFGPQYLIPAIKSYQEQHPKVRVSLTLSDRFDDILKDNFDLAIRVTSDLLDSSLMVRAIADTTVGLYASPAYLEKYGTPRTADELVGHRGIHYSLSRHGPCWNLPEGSGTRKIAMEWSLDVNNGRAQCEAAAQSMGISQIPDFIAGNDLANGRLVEVLPELAWHNKIYAIYPHRQLLSPKVSSFIDHLGNYYRQHKNW